MTLTKTFPTDRPAGLPVADTRLINAGMVERNTAGVPRVGILPAHYNPLVTGTAGMSYQVAAFNAVTSRSGNGVEFIANDGATSVATTAAPGANSRIDVIWVRPLFTTYADGSSDPVFGVTQGAPAASPSKPAIPAGALELATAVVLSTTTQTSTAVITQTHPYTAMEGGTVSVRNATELAGWTPADGAMAYQMDVGQTYQRFGSAWIPVFAPGPWISYTPAWGGSTGTPTLGTSIISGRYSRCGSAITFEVYLKLQTGANGNGAGNFTFTLPFTSAPGALRTPAVAHLENSGVGFYTGTGMIEPNSGIVQLIAFNASAGAIWSAGSGFSLSSVVVVSGTYQAA